MRQEFYDRRALAIMECAERGMTKASAARKLGLTAQTIAKYSKLYEIEFEPSPAGIGIEEFREAAAAGISRMDAARRFGVSYSTIHKICSETGVEFDRPGKGAADEERADAMEAMYRAGKTLEEIGQLYGVSRERVRQVISKYRGVTASDGGQSIRAKIEREHKRAEREAACYRKNGCSIAQLRNLQKIGVAMRKAGATIYQTPTGAFRNQRNNALGRGIPWELTLWDWWRIWQQSGKWEKRGRHADDYVMCRFKDEGSYSIGNVYIATLRHNATVQPNNPYRKGHPDFAKVISLKSSRARKARGARMVCSTEGCGGEYHSLGLCKRCYQREWARANRAKGVA